MLHECKIILSISKTIALNCDVRPDVQRIFLQAHYTHPPLLIGPEFAKG